MYDFRHQKKLVIPLLALAHPTTAQKKIIIMFYRPYQSIEDEPLSLQL